MKTAICAIAKNENAYINEWVSYHLDLGFDKIYLYDNNDDSTPFVGDFIDRKDAVVIKKWKDYNRYADQITAYNDFIEHDARKYDWCAFIDIDEFICLNVPTITDFLDDAPIDSNVVLNWRVYGDCGVIEGDELKPVRLRFLQEKRTMDYAIYKSFVNFKEHPDYRAISPHCVTAEELYENVPCVDSRFEKVICDCGGRIIASYDDIRQNKCYIAHYQTKSLSEFLKYKYNEQDGYATLNYYFRINERTIEKEEYIRRYFGKDNGSNKEGK